MITEANTQKLIEVIRSTEFRNSYEHFLQRPKDIITKSGQIEDLYTWEELEESYQEWLWLYSRLAYKIDRAAFSPTWLPICKGLDYHVDLNKPQWPVYEMWGCGMWDWEMRVHTLSMRALSIPLGCIEKYLLIETYRTSLIPETSSHKAIYFDFLRGNRFRLENDWQVFVPAEIKAYKHDFEDKGIVEGLYPYQLNRLPGHLQIKVIKLVSNTWYSSIAFNGFLEKVQTVKDLIYLLYIGLWREIDYLEFWSQGYMTYRLKSSRKVDLAAKRLIDATTWELEFWPYKKEIQHCFEKRVYKHDSSF